MLHHTFGPGDHFRHRAIHIHRVVERRLGCKSANRCLIAQAVCRLRINGAVQHDAIPLINGHIKRLEEGKCKPQSSGIFINLISNLERAGDHLDYIADTMVNSLK